MTVGGTTPVESLGPSELVAGRASTDPEHVEGGRKTLRAMAREVNRQLSGAAQGDVREEAMIRFLPDEDDWQSRIVVPDPQALAATKRSRLWSSSGRSGRTSIRPLSARSGTWAIVSWSAW